MRTPVEDGRAYSTDPRRGFRPSGVHDTVRYGEGASSRDVRRADYVRGGGPPKTRIDTCSEGLPPRTARTPNCTTYRAPSPVSYVSYTPDERNTFVAG